VSPASVPAHHAQQFGYRLGCHPMALTRTAGDIKAVFNHYF
jgi:hypothetical protein